MLHVHTISAPPMPYASLPTWLRVDHNDLPQECKPSPLRAVCAITIMRSCLPVYFPIPLEPTLTVDNVVGVLENVAVERRKEVWFRGGIVSHPQLEEIYQKYSTEEQRIHACADIFVNCCPPHSSWTHLCRGLYEENEMTAARKAKTFLPQPGERIIVEVY